MSWWLVRFYLSIAILDYIFALPQSHANPKRHPIASKKNIFEIGRNKNSDDFDNEQKSLEDKNSVSRETLSSVQNENERGLTVGDTFTPTELLPIAEKLFQKVGEPGSGKGFVSSTYSPQELSDKLFEAYFLTTKRIVTVKDIDIAGIDALQALALSGENVNSQAEAVTEAGETMYLRGQYVKLKPKRSKYKLVTKVVTPDTKDSKRRGIQLAKKLNKKRHLIINKRRDNKEKQDGNKKARKQYKRKDSSDLIENDVTKNPMCRWRYECSNMADLDTCHLHSECKKNTSDTSFDQIPSQHKSDEHSSAIIQFRKMIGISPIDEEVEKILESRNLQLKSSNADAVERVESLAEYFNNIIVQENLAYTTVLSPKDNAVNSHMLIGEDKELEATDLIEENNSKRRR